MNRMKMSIVSNRCSVPWRMKCFHYEAAEEIHDTINRMSAKYEKKRDYKCFYKEDVTTYYSSPAPCNSAQTVHYTIPKSNE